MAFDYYMNMEKLVLKVAQTHIDWMFDSNIDPDDPPFLLEDIFLHNLENGFVAITQMSCFIESFLNTIMNSCMHCEDEALLKCTINEKISMIFLYYRKSFAGIKSTHCWEAFRKVTKVRNEMIHFKKTYLGVAGELPDFSLAGERVSEFFTKGNMQKLMDKHIELAKAIATELGLCIFDDVEVFHCDGMSLFVNYVYDPNGFPKERHFRK